MPDAVTEPAPAKINPFLRVLGRRDDGYHDIETLILPVTLADGVQAVAADELRLSIVGELADEVPPDESNLVLRAAMALRKRIDESRGAHLLLSKRIPVAAGLGGGSADAAATLRALDRLWGCGLGVEGLIEVAAEVGSDVPALLYEVPVLVEGRGEIVAPVDVPKTWWVLLAQPFDVSSRDAYRWWDDDGGSPGPDPAPLSETLKAGDVEKAAGLLFNDLEAPVASRHPQIAEAGERLRQAGALGVVMSGSGPTVAAMARDAAQAEEVAKACGGIVVASFRSVAGSTWAHQSEDGWADRSARDVIAEEPW